MLEMDSNEFNIGTSAWIKCDSDRRSEILDFFKHLSANMQISLIPTVGERGEDDITNYVNNIIRH